MEFDDDNNHQEAEMGAEDNDASNRPDEHFANNPFNNAGGVVTVQEEVEDREASEAEVDGATNRSTTAASEEDAGARGGQGPAHDAAVINAVNLMAGTAVIGEVLPVGRGAFGGGGKGAAFGSNVVRPGPYNMQKGMGKGKGEPRVVNGPPMPRMPAPRFPMKERQVPLTPAEERRRRGAPWKDPCCDWDVCAEVLTKASLDQAALNRVITTKDRKGVLSWLTSRDNTNYNLYRVYKCWCAISLYDATYGEKFSTLASAPAPRMVDLMKQFILKETNHWGITPAQRGFWEQLVTQNGFTPEEMEALFNDYFVPSWEQEVVLSDEECERSKKTKDPKGLGLGDLQIAEVRARRNTLRRQLTTVKEQLENLEREKRDLQREARAGNGPLELPPGMDMQQLLAAMAVLSNPAPAMPALENAPPAVGGGNVAADAAAAGGAILHPELDAFFAADAALEEDVAGASEEDDLLADE
eukprot:g18577.t1